MFVDTLQSLSCDIVTESSVWDVVVFHYYNDLRSCFVRGVLLEENRMCIGEVEL